MTAYIPGTTILPFGSGRWRRSGRPAPTRRAPHLRLVAVVASRRLAAKRVQAVGIEHDAVPPTRRTRHAQRLDQPLRHALARHLDEPEGRDADHLRLRAVPQELLSETAEH